MDEYFKKHVDGNLKTAKAIRQKINNYLIPAIGALKIDAVEPMHIDNMLEMIVDANAPTTANDVLTYSKQIFNYAIADFDLTAEIWRMSLDNKTGTAIDIPLTEPALEIIKGLLAINLDGNDYLIPAQGVRTSKIGHIGVDYLNKPIKNLVYPLMDGVEPFHIHDFRGTLKTHLGKMGVDRFVSGGAILYQNVSHIRA